MRFEQYYLSCLSQASYLIGDESTGQAVVIDPRRDVEEYLADAKTAGLTIVGTILTHFHADFISGHLELAKATGAWIGYGAAATAEFDFRPLSDGEKISLGDVQLQIMATPGHTPESISILVYERANDPVPYGVLTGDTLFIGDVGRPDLLTSIGISQDDLAAQLYNSIHHKLLRLDDSVRVYPAHGAGSACGKNLSTETDSTIGKQRHTNYACLPMTQEQFVALVTQGQPPAPAYFGYNAQANKQDRDARELDATIPELTIEEFNQLISNGAAILDSRDPSDFVTGHIKNSINVCFYSRLAEYAGMVMDPHAPFIVVADPMEEQDTAVRMARIGFDHCLGYLPEVEKYLLDHPEESQQASRLTPAQMVEAIKDERVQLVDCRNQAETSQGMVESALVVPLPQLLNRIDEIDPTRPVLFYCASGYRSSVATSLLMKLGYCDVSDVIGGYQAIKAMSVTH